jgi:glycine betaine catabolism A
MIIERSRTDVAARTLPGPCFTDPAWFQRELEAIHHQLWLFAGRADEVATPGAYVLRNFGNASVILVRGDDGKVRAFHNVCRHRGTRLVNDDSGQFKARIQCRYHSWTYKLDGTLDKAPHMDGVDGFKESDWPLNAIALEDWEGLLFINLAPQPQPFAQHLAGLDRKFANWKLRELKLVERRRYELHANWKLIISNYHECLHCPPAHPQLNRLSHYLSGDNEPAQPTYLGARMQLKDEFKTLSLLDAPRRASLPGLTDDERRHIYYYALLPNLLLNLHPDYVVTFRLMPLSERRTDIVCEWLMHPDEISKADFDPSDAIDFWHLTNQQDWELSDLAQAGISSKGYRPGPYSNREDLLIAFDRWVLGRLGEK